ncbi:MAG: family 10 glycosylhydrolase [Armatimonadetes bacterium]|nr:family 10 glycosylhydrolase [Armatimonadota bacterium]
MNHQTPFVAAAYLSVAVATVSLAAMPTRAFAQAPLPTPITVPPPPAPPAPYLPFPQFGTLPLDEANNGFGFAQTTARAKNLQARMQWIDATANLDRVNSAEKVKAVVAAIKGAGFTDICFDIKPIGGEVLYNSKIAPKIKSFTKPGQPTKTLPFDFDPLAAMATECKAQGINLIVNFNAFAEGHLLFGTGPGFANRQWQTVLYEEKPTLLLPALSVPLTGGGGSGFPLTAPAPLSVAVRPNELPIEATEVAVYTDAAKVVADLPKRNPAAGFVVIVDAAGKVIAQVQGSQFAALSVAIPPGGAALVAQEETTASALRRYVVVGSKPVLSGSPKYVPIGDRPRRQIPLMTNPFREDVRARMLAILTEVVTNYDVNGIIFDDRLRYAGLDADFSPEAQATFTQYMGKPVAFPGDVLRYSYKFPTMERTMTPGKYYDAWLVFRALTLRNFLADATRTVKTIKPATTVATYVGSWYPDYPDVGANWASPDFRAGFRFLSPSYAETGWAGVTDFVVTGCYYNTATIAEAVASGVDIGETVEAAGQFSNRAVGNAAWVYAGIQLSDFAGKTPADLKRALQAAAATTQGVMVFDFSHDWEKWRPVLAEAFAKPATPPHLAPASLADVRAAQAAKKAAGIIDPPTILYRGKSGTGF